jgi:hypothetical protein
VIPDVAAGGRGAGRVAGVEARIDAPALHACLVVGAVGVDAALDRHAVDIRVAAETLRAAAAGNVTARTADGVDGARVVYEAGVNAVVVVANLVVVAVFIDDALKFLAADFRVSRVSGRAIAERGVLDDSADGVLTTVAGVHALGAEAGLVLTALAVRQAANKYGCGWNALYPGVTREPIGTRANGLMRLHFAEGISGAWVIDVARVAADAVDARLVHRAVGVRLTAGKNGRRDGRGWWIACSLWVSIVSSDTCAHCIVVSCIAFSIGATIGKTAGVHTVARVTLLGGAAVLISVALWSANDLLALIILIHQETFRALACNCPGGKGIKHSALLANRAGVLCLAGVVTSLIGTCKKGRTVCVHTTFRVFRNNRLSTICITISLQGWCTCARLLVVCCFTLGTLGTWAASAK